MIRKVLSAWVSLKSDRQGNLWGTVLPEQGPEVAQVVHGQLGLPLTMMVAVDERAKSGVYRLTYLFSLIDKPAFLALEMAVDGQAAEYPSWTPAVPAANWHEREARDLLGVVPVGHPDPRRLVLHGNWPHGYHPLRQDAPSEVAATAPRRFSFRPPGEEAMQIPVGPIHAGIIEPGHFRFTAVGEQIQALEANLFYTHRGIEKWCEGKPVMTVLAAAERLCGVCSLTNSLAFCQAVEAIAKVEVPPAARYGRVLLCELERLYNHIGDLGNICAGTAVALGTMAGTRIKEQLQQLNDALTGSRFLRGILVPGGLRRPLAAEGIDKVLREVRRDAAMLADTLLGHASFMDRLDHTGIVDRATAWRLGAVGVAARASGIDRDCRRDHPHAAYHELRWQVPVHQEGDVAARLKVRIEEIEQSLSLIEQARAALLAMATTTTTTMKPGDWAAVIDEYPAGRGWGVAESPRGETVHWLEIDAQGLVSRYRVRTGSYANWPVVVAAVPGNMVPDFPLINKSFELCYACSDR
ncbi:NADH-quinone oxidoreductase subunit C [Heliophilum fasciatum]|uniref:Ni,Fe-hydrogenase III large subunit n=1 Tax=Heliophilum fasciatum TaxID=35700 RepID=A0A4R2RIE8_9FIRM|nr:NADH-quinone oxidoreductase subunit C [Heliophilum fasciatum]MCW2278675.1 Ni,Fe-hydrogenase III large subunit/Ni,Fe-hydrogenase III component G [Heliophilum fasciatum]TCP62604.1 Ni,Fe-hydrogenase III large subunit [Heliophilum fasciatum]